MTNQTNHPTFGHSFISTTVLLILSKPYSPNKKDSSPILLSLASSVTDQVKVGWQDNFKAIYCGTALKILMKLGGRII